MKKIIALLLAVLTLAGVTAGATDAENEIMLIEEATEEVMVETAIPMPSVVFQSGKIKEVTEENITIEISEGEEIVLTSKLIGFEGLTYELQWQYNDGKGWKDVEGATEGTYTFEADEENVSFQWRLMVTL